MPKTTALLLCALLVVCAISLTHCSGSSTISITLAPTSIPALNPGQTQAITATVSNDRDNEGVTWTLTGAGTLTDETTTSVTYVAPNTVPAATSVTITATSVANTTITATVSISLNAVFAFSTTSLPAGTVNVPYNGVITTTGATGPFTWSLTAGSLPPGLTFGNSTTASLTISGTPVTAGTSTFTIQVIDAAGAAIAQTLSLVIEVPPPLAIATKTLPNGTVDTEYVGTNGFQLVASGGKAPYTWALINSTTLPTGLNLNAGGQITGTPTVAGTTQFTVQVTDSTTPNAETATGSLSITVTPSVANDIELNGTYAFLLTGFQGIPSSYYASAGSFTANGQGAITGGVIDITGSSGPQTFTTGSYAIGTNQLGTISLPVGRAFSFTLTADGSRGSIIEYDSPTLGIQASGVLFKQDTSAFSVSEIINPYVFGFLGVDPQGDRYVIGGQLTADGAGNFNNGVSDFDDNGTVPSMAPVTATGTYTIPGASTTGRGTATLIIGGSSTSYAFYIVSGSQLLFIETDSSGSHVSGTMVSQSGAAASGSAVFETAALAASTTTAIGQVGLVQFGSPLIMNSDENSGGMMTMPVSSGTASFTGPNGNGRVTMSGSNISGAGPDPIIYLAGPDQGFIIGTDANVTFGSLAAQEPPAGGLGFNASSLTGTYAGGSIPPIVANGNNEIDNLSSNGVSALSFNTNTSSLSNGLGQNQTPSATYTIGTNGRGNQTGTGTGNTGIIYMVSPTEYYYLNSLFVSGTDTNAMIEHFVH